MCLCNDAGRLEKHRAHPEPGIDAHRRLRGDAEALRAEPIEFLDAVLAVAAVAAPVPFARGAAFARHGVGAAHHAHDEIAGYEPCCRVRGRHYTKRFVTDDEAVAAVWR
jgi:hypothetical protein